MNFYITLSNVLILLLLINKIEISKAEEFKFEKFSENQTMTFRTYKEIEENIMFNEIKHSSNDEVSKFIFH